ncbi:MAG TPA: serine/threonine protein kinase, partial [Planctomycetes bacterium]|nr:serine/threonine protein kinase [Planctomycetota bacterium]
MVRFSWIGIAGFSCRIKPLSFDETMLRSRPREKGTSASMAPSADDEDDERPVESEDLLEWGRDEGSVEAGIERFFQLGQQEGLTLGDGAGEGSDSLPTQELRSVIEDFTRDLGPQLGGRWEIPRRMGPYVLSHYVGHGGMGVVFKGVHRDTGQSAAVKLVPESRDDLVRALEREAASLENSPHPHIPEFFGSGRSGGYAWVASRWIDGKSLADEIHERSTVREASPTPAAPSTASTGTAGALSSRGRRRHKARREELRRVIGWARDMARSLQAIHEEGRVHRDVKPSNLVLDDNGKIWLIDFGLAERTHGDSDDPLAFHLAGTVPYMSPEQTWGGRVGVGPPSDVYALAVTFHEVITGCRVVQSEGGGALREIALSEVPRLSDLVGGIPEDLDRIFLKATRKNPSERYQQAGQLARDLEDWLEGRTPHFAVAMAERRAVLRDAAYLVLLLSVTALLAWTLAPTATERRWSELRGLMEAGRAEEVYDALVEEGNRFT